MDFKQLKALVTVVEVGSVTRAAELLHLVQPAVTRQIKTLEQEFGVPLFERTRQGMRPTDAGANLAARARRALAELERARAELAPSPGVITGVVTLGLLESAAALIAEPMLSAVLHDHPAIELRLQTGYSGHLQRWLDEGELDLTLLYNLTSSPSLNVTPLVREQLWVVASPAEGLHAGQPVPFSNLVDRSFVMPTAGHGLRVLIEAAAGRAAIKLDTSVQTNSMALQKQLVLAGHGLTILPAAGIAADVAAGTASAAPLRDPEVWRSIVLAMPRTGRIPPAVGVVAREMTRQVRIAVKQGRWPSAELLGRDEES
jgi:DNA-binding transcriptional LysR family regulator